MAKQRKIFWTKERKIWLKVFGIMATFIIPILSILLFVAYSFIKNWKNVIYDFSSIFKNNPLALAICILLSIGVWSLFCTYWLIFKVKSKDNKYLKKADSDLYGSARWLKNDLDPENQSPLDEYLKFFMIKPDKPFWLTASEKGKTGEIIMHGANVRDVVHNLILGSTGSGKGQKLIIPNAIGNARLEEVRDENGNLIKCKPAMLFTDPKGELKELLSGELARNDYEVLTLNLRNPDESSFWNPLQNIYDYWIKALDWEKQNIESNRFLSFDLVEKYIIDNKLICNIHKETHCFECISAFNEFRKQELEKIHQKINDVKNDYELDVETRDGKIELLNEEVTKFNEWIILYTIKNDNIWFVDDEQKDITIYNMQEKYKNSAYEEITDITETLLDCGEDTKNKNFYDTAKGLMSGMIKVMLEVIEKDRSLLPLEKFNLPTIAKLMANEKQLKKWWKAYATNGREINDSWTSASKVIGQSEKQAPMYFSIISTALRIFEDKPLRKLLCTPKKRENILDLFSVVNKNKPKAIFIVLPDEKKDKHPLAALFIAQLYKANVFVASQNVTIKGKDELDRDMLWFLDEFANMPAIPNFDTYLTVSRGRRMFFALAVQNLSQIDQRYKDNGKTIRAACKLWTYLKSADKDDLKVISEICGDETILTSSHSENSENQKNKSWSMTSKKLINPTNLKLLNPEMGVIIHESTNPSICRFLMAYEFHKYLNLQAKFKETLKLQKFNYEEDHYFDLFKIDFDELEEHDLDDENDEDIEENDDNSDSNFFEGIEGIDLEDYENIDSEEKQLEHEIKVAEKELELRDKIYSLNKPQSQMTTEEKEEYIKLNEQLAKVTTAKLKLSFLTKYKKEN